MKSCHTVNEWLDAMVDDELGPEEAAHAEEHLRLCPSCRVELDGLRAVKQAAASLPRELKTRRELWEGIEDRLQVQQKARPRLNPAVIAVAATIVVAVALAFLLAPDRSAAPTTGGDTMNGAIAIASYESTSYESVRAEYEQARHDLLEVIEARRHQLAPKRSRSLSTTWGSSTRPSSTSNRRSQPTRERAGSTTSFSSRIDNRSISFGGQRDCPPESINHEKQTGKKKEPS